MHAIVVAPGKGSDGAGQRRTERFDQRVRDHAVRQYKPIKSTGIKGRLDDGASALVRISGDQQDIGTTGCQSRDLGGVVRLAVHMGGRHQNLTTQPFECFGE